MFFRNARLKLSSHFQLAQSPPRAAAPTPPREHVKPQPTKSASNVRSVANSRHTPIHRYVDCRQGVLPNEDEPIQRSRERNGDELDGDNDECPRVHADAVRKDCVYCTAGSGSWEGVGVCLQSSVSKVLMDAAQYQHWCYLAPWAGWRGLIAQWTACARGHERITKRHRL